MGGQCKKRYGSKEANKLNVQQAMVWCGT